MARIVIEGLSERQRKYLLESVQVTLGIMRDIESALKGPKTQSAVVVTKPPASVLPMVNLPRLNWKDAIAAMRAGELDEYIGLQLTTSAYASRHILMRKYPDVEITVEPQDERVSKVTARLREERGDVA